MGAVGRPGEGSRHTPGSRSLRRVPSQTGAPLSHRGHLKKKKKVNVLSGFKLSSINHQYGQTSLSTVSVGKCFAVVPYSAIKDLPNTSIDHSWLLLRWVYYEHHQTVRPQMSRHAAECWPMTERSVYLPQQNTYTWNRFSTAATPAFIEPAVSPASEQAWLPTLTQRENHFRDQETRWRFTLEKHQLNNLTLSLAAWFALPDYFYRNNKYIGLWRYHRLRARGISASHLLL